MAIDQVERVSAEYPISPSDIEQYSQKGHILLRGFVHPSAVTELRRAVLDAHERLLTPEDRLPAATTYDKAFRITENLWEIDDVIKKHVLSPRYASAAAKLLGCRDVRVYHDLTFFKEGLGKSGFTPYHQDGHYWPLDTTKCITIWIPLVDCPLEMGPMSFVSGSHLSRAAAHLEITDESDELIRRLIREDKLTEAPAQDMKAGDATLHNCWTYHAASPNKTPRVREAFAIVYYDADALIPTNPPINKRRAANLAKWFPGAQPGAVAASPKNPAVLALYGHTAAPSVIDIRPATAVRVSDEDAADGLVQEIVDGLRKPFNEKTLPGMLLYDESGLRLFEEITYQPDYYLTNLEIDILSRHANEIANTISEGALVVELGAGALRKTALLLDALEAQRKSVSYYALDLSRPELERTLGELAGRYQYVKLFGLWGTYDDGRDWLAQQTHRPPVTVLWLGSSIGNMTRGEAAQFVKGFGEILQPQDTFLVAIDGRAPADSVRAAYNDRGGVTRRFALNTLRVANRLFGRDIVDTTAFDYRPYYNEVRGRNEAYLRCSKTQKIVIPTRTEDSDSESEDAPVEVCIFEGEHIRFGFSHKYNAVERSTLYAKADAHVQNEWTHGDHGYALSMLSWQRK